MTDTNEPIQPTLQPPTPADQQQIDLKDLFATIGELYYTIRLSKQQQPPTS